MFMEENKFIFRIPTINKTDLEVPLIAGTTLFVLGSNGTGKSALMQLAYSQNIKNAKRILAHRQTWFTSNSMVLTSSDKQNIERQIANHDNGMNSRWVDNHHSQRSSISIFDLINSENIRARNIAKEVDADNLDSAKKLSSIQAPIKAINELLALSNLPISISLGKNDDLLASKNGGNEYSIAELSDGERNALLIAADVLTSAPESLIIIDEPERHLHRSIISPLLSSLFKKRQDCAFVVSTHEVFLPIDNIGSHTLLVRECLWESKSIKNWDIDLISNTENIPDEVKREILGSKRKILFVEGITKSLDRQIYQLVYPELTVQPLESCADVQRAVEGISNTEQLHWLDVFGLIDSDDRTHEQIENLRAKKIIALKCYSVEALYYHTKSIEKVAKKYAEITGRNWEELYQAAISTIIPNITAAKDRLCSRLCEKKVRNDVMSQLPKHGDILKKEPFKLKFLLEDYFNKEAAIFDSLIKTHNLNGLIERYPIRETTVLGSITNAIGLDRPTYEDVVRKLIVDDKEVLEFFRTYLGELTKLIAEKGKRE
jgi:ABC-type cobalamin/Fe3+-siderophores transport system ATPase subunit